jgi:hypothetical protein
MGITNADGTYTAWCIPPGTYKVFFFTDKVVSPNCYAFEWYSDKADFVNATPVSVTANHTTPNINAQLGSGSAISGRVTNSLGQGIENVAVNVYNTSNEWVCDAYTDLNGDYTAYGLRTGTYKIYFEADFAVVDDLCLSNPYQSEWYNDKADFNSATPVTVTAPDTTRNINAQLSNNAGNVKSEVLSLYGVSNAQCGNTSSLWSQVKNTGTITLPFSARVWYWVTGPSWSGSHWVGSASIAGLAVNTTKWYSYAWTIPSSATAGSYVYWAQAWITGKAISAWKGPQTFKVACGGSTVSARVSSLWAVYNARCGHTSNLWSQVKNTGSSVLPSSARVWYWVTGPSWSGSHWVGSASIAGLAVNTTKWYSYAWTIPSSATAGSYVYWAQAWITGKAISAWKGPQGFSVSCQ